MILTAIMLTFYHAVRSQDTYVMQNNVPRAVRVSCDTSNTTGSPQSNLQQPDLAVN